MPATESSLTNARRPSRLTKAVRFVREVTVETLELQRKLRRRFPAASFHD